jgi:photosystem II stability/assembly factor-like uncharacterized protein
MRATTNLTAIVAAAMLGVCVLPVRADAPQPQMAEVMPLAASRSVILDFTEANARAVAVGERGHVLVSESRADWRQIAEVPTRATLTAVTAVGDRVWAVGHDGVVLHSADGGLSWELQRHEPWSPPQDDEDFFSRDTRLGAPLLDVMFTDADNGFAIGAYALMLRTRDGGATWEPLVVTADAPEAVDGVDEVADDAGDSWTFAQDDLALDAEEDPHLNGIARLGDGSLFIVAERGSAFRSRDDGDSWERIQLPYDGSMFGVLALGDTHVLAYGLRGNVFESLDGGDSWQRLETDTELSLMGAAALSDGGIVVVGANGLVLYRPDHASPFRQHTFVNADEETPVLAGVLPLGTRTLIVSGERGIGRFQLNGTEAAR